MTADPLVRMRASLTGLSVGDAFGQCFLSPAVVEECLADRKPPAGPWVWTDDTNMALSLVDVLSESGSVDQDALAVSFAKHFDASRGYRGAMPDLLAEYAAGADWRSVAPRLFEGSGSYGSGAAMRVAPLGAYFAHDLDQAVVEATKQAEITHTHPEGVAGAIAVAVAAGIAASGMTAPGSLVESVIRRIPHSEVRDRLERTRRLRREASLASIATLLGNDSGTTAQDTVPLAIWAAGLHLDNYPAALWLTAHAGGDVDTTCAIVGGIVGARVGIQGIPEEWLRRREPLPEWTRLHW
jgi:ADP-ribosylglycohydrolase